MKSILTVMKIGSSNKSDGISKKFMKKVCWKWKTNQCLVNTFTDK